METQELRELIKQELPHLFREDSEIQDLILRLSRQEFAPKQQTEDRFERLFAKLERDAEINNRRWEEQNRKWYENQAELRRMREDFDRKWQAQKEESERKWQEEREESARQWQAYKEESARKWEDADRKFEAHQEEFNRVHQEIMAISSKHDRAIGALGARWGIASEKTFRSALASVLEKSFGVRVINVNEYDGQGEVFLGRPDQVELDVIITNGTLILMELKSSVSKADMGLFERKARFYERRHGRKADRLMVVSPMIDANARLLGQDLGIEMFSDSVDIASLDPS